MTLQFNSKINFFLIIIFVYKFAFAYGEEPENNQNVSKEEEYTIDLEEIKQNGTTKECQYGENKIVQFIVLKNGEIYLVLNNMIQKIPLSIDLNTEDWEIACKEKEVIIISKMPLTNIIQKQTFLIENHKIEKLGSTVEDTTSNYFNHLYELAKNGKKELILKTNFKEVNYSYQYITAEEFEKLSNNLIESSNSYSVEHKIKIYDAFGILTSKLILFYYSNQKEFEKYPLEDFTLWISLWEELGWHTYEKFLVEYSKLFLSKKPDKGIQILKELINRKSNYLQSYMVLADFYWDNKNKEEAIKLYKQILDKEKDFHENYLFPIPEYIKIRVSNLKHE